MFIFFQTFLLALFIVYSAYSAPTNSSITTSTTCITNPQKALECSSLMQDWANKTVALAEVKTEIDDPRILALIDQCEDMKSCLKESCMYFGKTKDDIATACDGLALKNTEFMHCMMKIGEVKPTKSQFVCLEDRENTGDEYGDVMFTTKKQCTKGIMAHICGDKAVENFGKNCETMQKLTAMATSAIMAGKK